ncbi:hypothetical protein PVAP13_7KG130455 [Panicum virgatum]|uniref:Uncharacterized protein n=1 Tax=Panicum virgatum TaxID=38727 RepID=A0A8T0QKY9_PANVG|nr:hypothetical protein PVAP13_7KG130455 [Panicum virgatum]
MAARELGAGGACWEGQWRRRGRAVVARELDGGGAAGSQRAGHAQRRRRRGRVVAAAGKGGSGSRAQRRRCCGISAGKGGVREGWWRQGCPTAAGQPDAPTLREEPAAGKS